MRPLSCFFVLLLWLGCATRHQRSNADIALFLATVTDANDPRVAGVIDNVLKDIEQGTGVYDDEVRKYTFVAIGRLLQSDDSVRARVRLIAGRTVAMSSSPNGGLEFVSVLGALTVLTEFKDGDAVSLNVARLTEPSFRQTAVEDLRYLKAWEVTPDVERAFDAFYRRPKPDAAVLTSFLVFLNESPMTSPSVCRLVTRSKGDVASCCAVGLTAAINLEGRLKCDPSEPEGSNRQVTTVRD